MIVCLFFSSKFHVLIVLMPQSDISGSSDEESLEKEPKMKKAVMRAADEPRPGLGAKGLELRTGCAPNRARGGRDNREVRVINDPGVSEQEPSAHL